MRFSIITVSLNSGDDLKKTIESIISQSFRDFEVIVKDGMSTDGSIEKIEKMTGVSAEKLGNQASDSDGQNGESEKESDDKPGDQPVDSARDRIRIIRTKDSGIYDGMNQALKEAGGDYICFLNSGDCFYDDNVLEKVSAVIDGCTDTDRTSDNDIAEGKRRPDNDTTEGKRRPDIIYGDIFERVTGAVVKSNPKIDDFACFRNVPCHQACFYRKALIEKHPFEIRYKVRADYEQFLWCYFTEKASCSYLPELITSYEGGGLSDSHEGRKISDAEHKEITEKYIPAGKLVKYRLAMILSFASLRTMIARNPKTAGVYNKIKDFIYKK